MGRSDVFLLKAAISFDASVQEMFNSLACGGLLLLAEPGGEKDTQYLASLCKAERVSCCSFVPSQLDLLLRVMAPPSSTALKGTVIVTFAYIFNMCRSLSWAHARQCAMCWWAERPCRLHWLHASHSACRMRTCTTRTGQLRPLLMQQVPGLSDARKSV